MIRVAQHLGVMDISRERITEGTEELIADMPAQQVMKEMDEVMNLSSERIPERIEEASYVVKQILERS